MRLRLFGVLIVLFSFFSSQHCYGQLLKPEFDRKTGLYGYKNTSTGKWQILPQFEKAGVFLHNRAIVRQHSKDGLIDARGKMIAKPQFSELQGDSIFLFKRETDTIGLMNLEGKILIEGNYDHIEFNKDNNSAQLVKDNLFGYWDISGVVIKPISKYGISFESGLAYFNDGSKTGYFNNKGEIVLEVQEGKLYLLHKEYILHVAYGKETLYSLKGERKSECQELIQVESFGSVCKQSGKYVFLSHRYQYDPSFTEWDNMTPFTKNGIAVVKTGKRFGIIDTIEKAIVPFEYDTIQPLGEKFNRFTGEYENTLDYVLCKKDSLWGLINDKGEIIQPPAYTSAYLENNILIKEENNVVSIKDLVSNKKMPLEDIFVFNQGKAIYFFPENNKKEQYGLINKDGGIAKQASFNSLRSLWNGLYIAETDAGVGIIDTAAAIIVPTVFKELYILNDFVINRNPKNILFDNYVYALTRGGKTGVYSREGKKVVDTIWNDITLFDIDGQSFWGQDTKSLWQLIGSNGKVKKLSVDSPVLFQNKQAIASKKGKYGIIGIEGKTILPFKYDQLAVRQDGSILSLSKNKWGIISEEGKPVVKADYRYILAESNGLHLAFKNRWGILKNGLFDEGYGDLKPGRNELYADNAIQKTTLNFIELKELDEYNLDVFASEKTLTPFYQKANDYILTKVAPLLLPRTELKEATSIKAGKAIRKLSDQYIGKGTEILNATDSTVSLNFYEEVSGRGFNNVTDHNLVLAIVNGKLKEVALKDLFNEGEYKLFLNEVIAARLREADYRIIPSSKGDVLYYDENYFQLDRDGLVLKVNEKILDLTYDLVGPEIIIGYKELESIVNKNGVLSEFYKQ